MALYGTFVEMVGDIEVGDRGAEQLVELLGVVRNEYTRNPWGACSIMRFGILGPVEVIDDHGRVVALGVPGSARCWRSCCCTPVRSS
jgi:hypothetical protein